MFFLWIHGILAIIFWDEVSFPNEHGLILWHYFYNALLSDFFGFPKLAAPAIYLHPKSRHREEFEQIPKHCLEDACYHSVWVRSFNVMLLWFAYIYLFLERTVVDLNVTKYNRLLIFFSIIKVYFFLHKPKSIYLLTP